MREREGENMKSSSNNKEKHHQNHQIKEESSFHNRTSHFFYITCTTLTTIFFLHLIFNTNNTFKFTYEMLNFTQTNPPIPPNKEVVESCDMSKGRWIRDTNATYYTEDTCKTLPTLKNCFLHGRKDRDFLNWKWKPDQCELPRFDAVAFLSILRGKKMVFIGDSLARNHADSLLCILSTVETPTEAKVEHRDTTWEFPKHKFTLSAIWSQFLVTADMIDPNGPPRGGFRIDLDRVDPLWLDKLPTMDYVVFSAGHWFLRSNYVYEGGNLIGCTNCKDPDVTDIGPGRAIALAFRAALRAVNGCKRCRKRIVSIVRSYSPDHFEGGEWNHGGWCNRTWPVEREEVNRARPEWEFKRIQEEEVERARREGKGKGNVFEILDVTEVMATRADAHPGPHWRNLWKKAIRDCLHWCLPGPIDTWNGLLFEKIKGLAKN